MTCVNFVAPYFVLVLSIFLHCLPTEPIDTEPFLEVRLLRQMFCTLKNKPKSQSIITALNTKCNINISINDTHLPGIRCRLVWQIHAQLVVRRA